MVTSSCVLLLPGQDKTQRLRREMGCYVGVLARSHNRVSRKQIGVSLYKQREVNVYSQSHYLAPRPRT